MIALLFGYLYFTKSQPVGAANPTGPQHFQMEAFLQGATFGATNQSYFTNTGVLVQGGGIAASSTKASVTMKGNEFDSANILDYTINVGSVTLTLPASTSSICPSVSGQERTVYIRNATTTAASTLTLASGTNITLISASSTKVIDGATSGDDFARLEVTRKADNTCVALMQTFY